MINTNVASGNIVKLNTTDPLHFGAEPKIQRGKG